MYFSWGGAVIDMQAFVMPTGYELRKFAGYLDFTTLFMSFMLISTTPGSNSGLYFTGSSSGSKLAFDSTGGGNTNCAQFSRYSTSICLQCQQAYYLYKHTCYAEASGCPISSFRVFYGAKVYCKACHYSCSSCTNS